MRLISWNVNGIRAVQKKGFVEWLQSSGGDVVCIQETKAHKEQLDDELIHVEPYTSEWFSAEKKGYSSVATYSKIADYSVIKGFGIERFDSEGRVLRHDFAEFTLFNIYFPNGQRGDERLMYKMDFYAAALEHFEALRKAGRKLIICGDVNTAHKPIDLARPKENEKTSGFLPIERDWMDEFVDAGYIDTFRMFNQESDQYSWWNMRTRARERNVGWRIDYFFVSEELRENVKNAFIWQDVMGSDHCPVGIEIEF